MCTFAYLCLLVPTHAIHELLKEAVVVHFPYAAKCKGRYLAVTKLWRQADRMRNQRTVRVILVASTYTYNRSSSPQRCKILAFSVFIFASAVCPSQRVAQFRRGVGGARESNERL